MFTFGLHLPLPFLSFFDGQSENAFKEKYEDCSGQIPKPQIIFDGDNAINSHNPVGRENETRNNSFDRVDKRAHDDG